MCRSSTSGATWWIRLAALQSRSQRTACNWMSGVFFGGLIFIFLTSSFLFESFPLSNSGILGALISCVKSTVMALACSNHMLGRKVCSPNPGNFPDHMTSPGTRIEFILRMNKRWFQWTSKLGRFQLSEGSAVFCYWWNRSRPMGLKTGLLSI